MNTGDSSRAQKAHLGLRYLRTWSDPIANLVKIGSDHFSGSETYETETKGSTVSPS